MLSSTASPVTSVFVIHCATSSPNWKFALIWACRRGVGASDKRPDVVADATLLVALRVEIELRLPGLAGVGPEAGVEAVEARLDDRRATARVEIVEPLEVAARFDIAAPVVLKV